MTQVQSTLEHLRIARYWKHAREDGFDPEFCTAQIRKHHRLFGQRTARKRGVRRIRLPYADD